MSKGLLAQAFTKFFLGVIVVGTLLFVSAGSFRYWNAWLLMGILFIPMLFAGIIMMFKNPALLKKRLNAKETQGEQRLVVKLSGLMFLLGFVIAGLNFRFQRFILPNWTSAMSFVPASNIRIIPFSPA